MTEQPTALDLGEAIWEAFISVFSREDIIALTPRIRIAAMRHIGGWLMRPGPELTREELLDVRTWAFEELEALAADGEQPHKDREAPNA